MSTSSGDQGEGDPDVIMEKVSDEKIDEQPPSSSVKKKVAVAVKHPGVFMETCELEAETGTKLSPTPPDQDVKSEEPAAAEKKSEAVEPETTEPEQVLEKSRPRRSRVGGKRGKARQSTAGSTKDPETKDQRHEVKPEEGLDVKKEEDESDQTATEAASLVKQGKEIEVAAGAGQQTSSSSQAVEKSEASSADEGSQTDKDEEAKSTATPRRSKRREHLQHLKEVEAQKQALASYSRSKPADNPESDEDDLMADENLDDLDDGFEDDARLAKEPDIVAASSSEAAGGDGDGASICSELDSVESGSTSARSTRRGPCRGGGGGAASSKGGKKGTVRSSKKKLAGENTRGPGHSNRGKSRRAIFKRSATKAPTAVARAITSDRIFYNGQYFSKGDIVSVVDVEGGVYYAQLKGFLTDQYCEKSGVITWLLPTTESPPPETGFDPSTYIVGPEEELPRRLEHFTFVMHAPDDYFYYKNAPYPTMAVNRDQEYVLTRLGPKVRLLKSNGVAAFS